MRARLKFNERRSAPCDLTYPPATRPGSMSYRFCQNDDRRTGPNDGRHHGEQRPLTGRLRGRLADRGRLDGLSCLKHSTKPAGNSVARRLDRPYGRISIPIEQSLPTQSFGRPVTAIGKATAPYSNASRTGSFPPSRILRQRRLHSKVAIVSH
jgi:hypothetical protein